MKEYKVIECKLGEVRSLPPEHQKRVEIYDEKYKKWVKYIHSAYTYEGPVGFSSPENPYAPINAIAIYKTWTKESIVLAVPPPGFDLKDFDNSLRDLADVRFFKDEAQLLKEYLKEIKDAAVVSAYNGSLFDDPYVAKRVEMVLGLHYFKKLSFEYAPLPKYNELFAKGRKHLQVKYGGRVQLDYLELFKKFEVSDRASFKLESVADDYLPDLPKLHYSGTLEQLYVNDFNHFIRYNIRDTEILVGLEEKLSYLKVANEMVHSSTNQFKHIFGTVRMVDNAIVNYCHYELNKIVPDRWDTKDGSIQGAYVLFPQRGMHKNICSVDINSLYPSAIRALNISPETIRGQFTRNIQDWLCIYESRNELLTFRYEDGTLESKYTDEWVEYFLEKKWAVSGYGTVYTQEFKGIIPSILESWYITRKKYQALKKQYEAEKNTNKSKEIYELAAHYDRLQFIFKIKLNATYGCLSNYNFRFFRLESGESTTGTGRAILKHQCRKVNELVEGEYWVDFPLYESTKKIDELNKDRNNNDEEEEFIDIVHKDVSSIKSIIDAGTQEYYHADQLSYDIALDGPKFNGQFQSKTVLYGDSVTGDTMVIIDGEDDTIENWFARLGRKIGVTELPNDVELLLTRSCHDTIGVYKDDDSFVYCEYGIKLIYRHKTSKNIYEIFTETKSVKVTEDHSIMVVRDNKLIEIKPTELTLDDVLIELPNNWAELDGLDCDILYSNVVRIIDHGVINDWVYDISVDDEDNQYFFGGGILVHNTDSSYFTLDIDDLDAVTKVAEHITDRINESYPEFMRKAFLCQPGFDELIKCAREIVSDSGIFVEKKRYILHVVDNEGNKVDKMKIMGLDLKKTTLPKPIQKQLTGYISRLLNGEDWLSISRDVVKYKDTLMDFNNLHEVGLPKGINKIEDYTIRYEAEGMKARLPGHVAASIFYNQCLKEYEDHDSMVIESGMKIKVYYLKKPIGKFKAIALPTDQDIIPEWFVNDFIPKLDKDKQLSKLIDNPLKNILKAVNLHIPTAQYVEAHEVFVF